MASLKIIGVACMHNAEQERRDREAAMRYQQDLDKKELHNDTANMISDDEDAPGPSSDAKGKRPVDTGGLHKGP